ncbi:MAG: ChbG/HpnK family deacetylase [Verrucomicrobia bacterium]|nr:ChbG/HpnK family deacetylase [Verrucomicrobiota bacterium]
MKEAIFHGDDFAFSDSENGGIENAFNRGVLTSTSVIANCITPRTPRLNNLRSELKKSDIGIGVHLNLTYGEPLYGKWPTGTVFSMPGVKNGKPDWRLSVWEDWASRLSEDNVKFELRKQIKRVIEVFGKDRITHLDSHHAVTSLGPLRPIYFELAHEYDLALRPTSPLLEDADNAEFTPDTGFAEKAREQGVRTVDAVDMGKYYKGKNKTGPDALIDELEQMKDGQVIEFMFHPGNKKSDQWKWGELELLTNRKVIEAIKDLGIELVNYRRAR